MKIASGDGTHFLPTVIGRSYSVIAPAYRFDIITKTHGRLPQTNAFLEYRSRSLRVRFCVAYPDLGSIGRCKRVKSLTREVPNSGFRLSENDFFRPETDLPSFRRAGLSISKEREESRTRL